MPCNKILVSYILYHYIIIPKILVYCTLYSYIWNFGYSSIGGYCCVQKLIEARNRLAAHLQLDAQSIALSMGMSTDFECAVRVSFIRLFLQFPLLIDPLFLD